MPPNPQAKAQTLTRQKNYFITMIKQKVTQVGNWLSTRAQRPVLVSRSNLKLSDWWITIIRMLAFGVIITGLTFGAKQSYFNVDDSNVLGSEVDADLKLALLGFLNKSLDVILVSSLEYTASMIISIWMARSSPSQANPAHGATFADFGLKDELTKPWMTLVGFINRCKRTGWSWKSLLRCIFCLSISISVMLQGLAINTIAVPKERWYPNYLHSWKLTQSSREVMTVEHPKAALRAVDWYNLLGVGQSNVGRDSYPPWDRALSLSASYSFMGLTHVVPAVERPQKNWQYMYRMELDGDARKRWTALNTAFQFPDRPVESTSVDDEQVLEIFNWLRQTGHKLTSSSIGWTGNLTLVLPALNTICSSTPRVLSEGALNVTVPAGHIIDGRPTFTINLGPISSSGFPGANCLVTFRQALYPVNIWIVDIKGADVSFNGFGNDWDKSIHYEPANSTSDFPITRSLAIQARDSLPRLETIVQTSTLLQHFLLMSRMLQKADTAVNSDSAGLSIVIGTLL